MSHVQRGDPGAADWSESCLIDGGYGFLLARGKSQSLLIKLESKYPRCSEPSTDNALLRCTFHSLDGRCDHWVLRHAKRVVASESVAPCGGDLST